MGMYTGLRGTVELKQNVAEALASYWSDESDYQYNIWYYIGMRTGCDETLAFAQDGRSSFIPNGSVQYMPRDWVGFCELVGNRLTFCCSLKNYDKTIAKFIRLLPSIAKSWELEELYEEGLESHFHNSKGKEQ